MDSPGDFFDPVASFYDAKISGLEEDDETLADDTRFYLELAREMGEPVLELGVGTGRIYLELLAEGIDIDGIDLSQQMLEQLQENARERALSPSVWNADIADFDVDRSYDLIYAPARAFNHLSTLSDQRSALQTIHDALAPDGRFALNTYVPRFETIVNYGTPHEERIDVEGTSYRVVRTSHLEDEVNQTVRLQWEVYHEHDLITERETLIALISKRQFELLFELVGFTNWEVYGGFDGDLLESSDQEMVWVVER